MLARLVREDSGNRVAVERLVNALRQRRFLVPDSTQALATNKPLPNPAANSGRLALSPDGRFRANVVGATIEVREVASGLLHWTHSNAHASVIRSIFFDVGNQKLISASADGTAKVWLLTSNAPSLVLPHDGPVYHAEFSPDGSRIATASFDRTARLWDTATGHPIGERLNHRDAVNKVRFSPDGRWVITASDDQTARLWDATTGQPVCEPARFAEAVDDAWFVQDARHIQAQLAAGSRMAFRPTAGLLVPAWSPNQTAPEWQSSADPNDPRLVTLRKQLSPRHAAEVPFLELDPHGQLVATASMDKSACLWNVGSLALVAPPLIHDGGVNCIRFSPDGLRVVTSTSNRKVRLWDVATGQPLSDWITSPEAIEGVNFTKDGRWIVSSAGWRWELAVAKDHAPDWLPALAEAVAGVQMDMYDHATPVSPSAWQELQRRLQTSQASQPVPAWAVDFINHE
jgi:WD40 repeat protein